MPMPVHGARATGGAFQTAAIRRTSNAGPPFSALGDFAGQIHSPERPTGRAPEAGIPRARRDVTGAAIRYVRRTSPPRSPTSGKRHVQLKPRHALRGRFLAKWRFEWTPVRPGVTRMGWN